MGDQLSEDIKRKCFELCSQYVWLNVNQNELSFERIVGGITNQMVKCKLSTQSASNEGKPNEIAVKLYRKGDRPLDASDSIFNDFIIGLIISSESLGPKIYGITSDAVLMEYIDVLIIFHSIEKCHQFIAENQKDRQIVEELGKKLAKVHSLKPPIKQNSHWITQTFTEKNVNSYKKSPNCELILQNELKYFIENDFETEFKFLMKVIDSCNSPLVFSHNDFGCNNILIRNQKESNRLEDRVVLSDFEFSSYGFRGRDLGLVFDDWLHFNNISYDMNCHSIIEPFLKSYLLESIRIIGQEYSNNQMNSLQHLIYESKVFLLLQKLFSVLFYLNADQTIFRHLSKVEILKEGNQLFGKYLKLKRILIEENVINVSNE